MNFLVCKQMEYNICRLAAVMRMVLTIVATVIGIGVFVMQFYTTQDSVATPSSGKEIVSIMAVGDSIGHNIKSENLVGLVNIVNGSDIFIFNLEGVLVDSIQNIKACEGFPSHQSIFVSNSSFVNHLRLAPITIANLANNHIFDCSSEGVKETKRVLTENSILSVGAGQDLNAACEPLFIQAKGLDLAFVSYNFVIKDLVSADTHHAGAATLDACKHDYNSLKVEKGADVIIASIHLGEWSPNVTKEQVEIIQHLFDSGADIVIGHSPHMPQAIMSTKDGRLAFFSLGNFIFRPDYRMPSLAHTTIVPKIDLYADGRTDVTIYPVRIDNDGIPHIIEEGRNNNIISRIAEDSKKLNTFINITENSGHISVYRHYNENVQS
jgi:poly-gamma-glutamate capsule biosynthesis protein CapA/YwtB (metallophosphatase superfamily)